MKIQKKVASHPTTKKVVLVGRPYLPEKRISKKVKGSKSLFYAEAKKSQPSAKREDWRLVLSKKKEKKKRIKAQKAPKENKQRLRKVLKSASRLSDQATPSGCRLGTASPMLMSKGNNGDSQSPGDRT